MVLKQIAFMNVFGKIVPPARRFAGSNFLLVQGCVDESTFNRLVQEIHYKAGESFVQ